MRRNILTVFCLTAILFVAACNRSPAPQVKPIPSLTVEQLLANPLGYSHTMINVSGCFASGFERSILRSCSTENPTERIWVENAAIFEEIPRLPEVPEATPPELRSPDTHLKRSTSGTDLFRYDARRNAQAWKKLDALSDSTEKAPEVVLLGQFETIAPRDPSTKGFGFGHLGAYAHELILLDVLDSKPNAPL